MKNKILNHNSNSRLFHDRDRTNILKGWEQSAISYLVKRIPGWVTSNMLTGIGFLGNVITGVSFILGEYLNKYWLLLSLLGLFVNWFGDSLDGRLAYYRNKPRKWYGFSLDLMVDWLGTMLIGVGVIVYFDSFWEFTGYAFVAFYGWSMVIAILKYKITGKYLIDSGLLGPTEVRVVVGFIIILEVIATGSLPILALLVCLILFTFNLKDSIKLLRIADEKDKEEKLVQQENQVEKNA